MNHQMGKSAVHNCKWRVSAYLLLLLSPLIGGTSLLLFGLFLATGGYPLVTMNVGTIGSLFWDAGLSLIFFFQHSGMIRLMNHPKWPLPSRFGPALFSIFSGITLAMVMIFWQKTIPLISPGPVISWVIRGCFLLSVVGFILCSRTLPYLDPFGIRDLKHYLRNLPKQRPVFYQSGPYRWVRHPLYFFTLILIWACPDLTGDRLVFNLMWTIWIILGTGFEEMDLEATFGARYHQYQQQVPMLIPWCRQLFFRTSKKT